MHRVFIGIGSNLGDRQANILAALQRLRSRVAIGRVSAFYESAPAEGASGPAFLNVAAELETEFDRAAFERVLRDVETAVGRTSTTRLEARLIDLDLLVFDDDLHPRLAERQYNAVPLAEIAPRFAPFAKQNGASGLHRRERSLHFSANRQEEEPDVRLSLNRVGVSSVRRIVQLEIDGEQRVFNGEFTMVADLAPDKAGVHMSRFSEILEEATLDVLARDEKPARIERLVEEIAREIVRSQRAIRADVRLRADFGLERWTPVSGKRGEEIYTLIGIAHADEAGTRRVVGVEAEGMTACPCAQLMVREHSMRELIDAGFSEADARRALDALPVATHNQRGRGAILLGVSEGATQAVRAEDLVEIVESSMSSETYDLLKRPDEFFIVNKAHHNPKFVEDVVRGILARSLEMYSDLGDDTFVFASQINYESIHKHDAFAEGFGLFGEFRDELRTHRYVTAKTDLASWLGTRPSTVLL
ncbi:MAG TPA: GTP cyclohydrolase MptA [Candidatus Baltobacteraceae bacterium]|jgi:GTP cyclohydrolase-4|nr:GTP cyclohydrolase MptA [Candidatus Baltobacteraceae bacterium]